MDSVRILGRERELRTLELILRGDRCAHAYRFVGPPGVGKKLLALSLARAVLCSGDAAPAERAVPEGSAQALFPGMEPSEEGKKTESRKTRRPSGAGGRATGASAPRLGCGICPSCRAVDSLQHPDLLLYHDFSPPRWKERAELAAAVGVIPSSSDFDRASEETYLKVIGEIGEHYLLAPHPPPEPRKRDGFYLDPNPVFGGGGSRRPGGVFDANRLAEKLAREEGRGKLSSSARRLVSRLYFAESSRVTYRGSFGIHLVARREPQTPDRGSLRGILARASLWGRGKVAVIDDAHLMTEEAQNALLKTLEEPPRGSTILLVTHDPGALLPTIRSRTPEIVCGRLPATIISGELEAQGMTPAKAGFLAAWADGSMGRALTAELEGLISSRELILSFHRSLLQGELGRAMGFASELTGEAEFGKDRSRRLRHMRHNLDLLQMWYRDLALAAALGNQAEFLNEDLRADILGEGSGGSTELWRDLFGVVSRQVSLLNISSDFRLQGEDLVASMAAALARRGRGVSVSGGSPGGEIA